MPAKKTSHNASIQSRKSSPAFDSQDFSVLRELAASLHDLHRQMAAQYAPTVQHILRRGTRDPQLIEQTLDHLLNCACIPEGLALFKALCRYYFRINPAVTAEYVYAYRDLWDNDQDPEQPAAREAGA